MTTILIVDDEKSIRETLGIILSKEGYDIEKAQDVEIAFSHLVRRRFDIVITDIIMPKVSGIELLEKLKQLSPKTKVIIMTGEPTIETAIKSVQNGAADYLTKPIKREVLINTVKEVEEIKLLNDKRDVLEKENLKYQKELELLVAQKIDELQEAMQSIISLFSTVVEARDPYTAGHQRRVGNLCAAIATKMGLEEKVVEQLRIVGYIHDLGKIVVPSEILSKPGRLSDIEMKLIQSHSSAGYDMIRKVKLPDYLGKTILEHHERCDGSGYPNGLKDKDMWIGSKIIMVADVVEAMMSHRPYRPALGLDAAMTEITGKANILYDKDVVTACRELMVKEEYEIEDKEYKTRMI